MADTNQINKNSFLYPRSSYHSSVQPENLLFNANLQEFSQKVSYITNLHTGGKLSPEESYQKIKALWRELKRSKKTLGIASKTVSS